MIKCFALLQINNSSYYYFFSLVNIFLICNNIIMRWKYTTARAVRCGAGPSEWGIVSVLEYNLFNMKANIVRMNCWAYKITKKRNERNFYQFQIEYGHAVIGCDYMFYLWLIEMGVGRAEESNNFWLFRVSICLSARGVSRLYGRIKFPSFLMLRSHQCRKDLSNEVLCSEPCFKIHWMVSAAHCLQFIQTRRFISASSFPPNEPITSDLKNKETRRVTVNIMMTSFPPFTHNWVIKITIIVHAPFFNHKLTTKMINQNIYRELQHNFCRLFWCVLEKVNLK